MTTALLPDGPPPPGLRPGRGRDTHSILPAAPAPAASTRTVVVTLEEALRLLEETTAAAAAPSAPAGGLAARMGDVEQQLHVSLATNQRLAALLVAVVGEQAREIARLSALVG